MISRNGSAVHVRGAAGDREAAVVAQLHSLAPHLDGEPDPEFRAAMRARLVAMAAVRSPEPAPVSPLRRLLARRTDAAAPARWRARLTAGVAGAALTVTALSTVVALSADARPGDVLYGVKRGAEETQLALAGDSRRGETLLDLASTRLGELEHLLAEDPVALPAVVPAGDATAVLAAGADPELVLETLGTMDEQTTDGAAWLAERAVTSTDPAPLQELADWAAVQSAGLAALEPDVPDAALSAFDGSQDLLTEIGSRTAGLKDALDCAAGPAVAGADDLGPLPGPCVAVPAPESGQPATPPGTAGSTPPDPRTTVPGRSGGNTGAPGSGDHGSGTAGSPGEEVPGVDVPGDVPSGPPDGGLPSVPLPTAEVPVPGTPGPPPVLPGTSGSLPTPSVDAEVGVCLDPLAIGDCWPDHAVEAPAPPR